MKKLYHFTEEEHKEMGGKYHRQLLGFKNTVDSVCINLTNIYNNMVDKRKKNWEDIFIEQFSSVYSHELLHILLQQLAFEDREYHEERIIRLMNGEEWDKETRKIYSSE